MADASNNATAITVVAPPPATTYAKTLPDVSKIEVFSGQNFRRWQERIHSILDMHGVAYALTVPKPDSSNSVSASKSDDWSLANKVCRHTILSALSNDLFVVYCSYKEAKDIWDSMIMKYTAEDSVRQRFIIGNYYRWEMTKEKDIKVQINEYHKLLEDLKSENLSLPDEFVSELLIEKLPESWTDYKQHLKHRHKQMSLSDLITHIIIEDANRKECAAAKAKSLAAKSNVVQLQEQPNKKRYDQKKNKYNSKNSSPRATTPVFKKKGNCFVCGMQVTMHLSAVFKQRETTTLLRLRLT
uniref:Retrovirus-related Pol polyprotein from transposon TNT 1-94 n=1 Tax=Cajanus cajan TaxID=3821 RepID=A0A151QSJ9_CAJCA|nr:Retrovirus-related Pol polyprotein from transposon TNT 1-94 [Cajanus cajan]